jgi:predicted dehydrogenase
MTETIRWGVAAPGGIATKFAADLEHLDDAVITAVASRSQERADEFGDQFEIGHRHGSREALAADPDVDVVYVASPQSRHAPDTLMFLEAGKHVLCEKPFALNLHQTEAMIEAARVNGVFLMEALWSRFLPSYVALRDLLDNGEIGTPITVDADFGFVVPFDPEHRLFVNALGGGALLDLGIYPLQLAVGVLGPADSISAAGYVGETDVDETVDVVLHHAAGGLSLSRASIRFDLPNVAHIVGTDGHIELPASMHHPQQVIVHAGRRGERILDGSFEGNGLRFQATEVHRCLRAGARESPAMPLEETRRLAAIMTEARSQIGVRYPDDDEPRRNGTQPTGTSRT